MSSKYCRVIGDVMPTERPSMGDLLIYGLRCSELLSGPVQSVASQPVATNRDTNEHGQPA